MARIFLFRHTQTDDNKNRIFSGWRNPDINDEGVKEAEVLREKLKDQSPTKAYTSDQIRCINTLKIVLEPHQNVEVFEDVRIRERDYGDLTGQSKIGWEKRDPVNYKLWHRSYDVPPPNGESIAMVEKRVVPFLEEMEKNAKEKDVIFICASANSIRPMRKRYERMNNEEMSTFEHTPAQVYEYKI